MTHRTCRADGRHAATPATHLISIADAVGSNVVTGVQACDRCADYARRHYLGRVNAAGQEYRSVDRMTVHGLRYQRRAPASVGPCTRCGSRASARAELGTVAGPKVYCTAVRACTIRADRRRRW